MPVYEFLCGACGATQEKHLSVHDDHGRASVKCPTCGNYMEQFFSSAPGSSFTNKPGHETGLYDYDYGKKATWDLTPPGKMERLKKEGRIVNPFDRR